MKIMTNLWYDLRKNQSTALAQYEADLDQSRLSYLDCFIRNIYSINLRKQTIWLKLRTLWPPLWNLCKRFFKRTIFPEGLESCSAVIGPQSIFEVVSPSATLTCIKHLVFLALNYAVHWKQHQLRCIIQLRGWEIVHIRTFWAPKWNSWGWEHY